MRACCRAKQAMCGDDICALNVSLKAQGTVPPARLVPFSVAESGCLAWVAPKPAPDEGFCGHPRRSHPAHPVLHNRAGAGAMLALLVLAMVWPPGCSEHDKRRWRYQSAGTNLQLALESEDADVRRDAVVRICESRYVASEDAFHVLDAVARTDPITQIRCIAIRGLSAYEDPRPVATILTILQATSECDNALPADEDVRWEAVRALVAVEGSGGLDGPQREIAREVCIKLVESDPARNVRIAAASALRGFRHRAVFQPLIRALRDEDFAIADTAEHSLIALTGVTHDYDADAWEQWVARAQNPFENAGRTPQTTRPAGPTWWDKQKRAWRRALKLGNTD